MVSQEFWRKDGPYSWVILMTIVLCRYVGIGFAIASAGVLADEYPRHFGVEQAQTNIIGSALLGVFLFSGESFFFSIPRCNIPTSKNNHSEKFLISSHEMKDVDAL